MTPVQCQAKHGFARPKLCFAARAGTFSVALREVQAASVSRHSGKSSRFEGGLSRLCWQA